MMRGSATFVVAVLGICLATTRGAAQTSPTLPPAYVAVKGGLAPIGSVNTDHEGASFGKGDNGMENMLSAAQDESGLNVSFAAEFGYLFSLHPFFALGPALGMHTWRSDKASSEAEPASVSIGLDLSLVPQARLPLSDSFELYVSLPLGITLSLLNEYKTWVTGPGMAEDVDPTYGWSFGAYLGMRWALYGSFGVLTELGYQRYAFTHGVEFRVDKTLDSEGAGGTIDLALVTQQLRWNLGVFF